MLIPPEVFEIHKIADTESSRYAMGAVKLERDPESQQPIAIATDGRRLMTVTWNEEQHADYPAPDNFDVSPVNHDDERLWNVLVPVKSCQEAKTRLAPKKSVKPILRNVALDEHAINGTVKLYGTDIDTGRTLEPRIIDGKFPKWRDVFPVYDDLTATRIRVDAKYLAELVTVAKAIGCDAENPGVELVVPMDSTRPLVLETVSANQPKATAVLMPLKRKEDERLSQRAANARKHVEEFAEQVGADKALDILLGVLSPRQMITMDEIISER